MPVRTLQSPQDLGQYDAWVRSHPAGGLWQSLEWKRYQESLGRETRIYVTEEGGRIVASALVVIDRTTGGWSTWEIPRGPLGTMENIDELLQSIGTDARSGRCLSLYCSPAAFSIFHFPFTVSPRYVMPSATRILDLTKDDDALLEQMKPKGRYNIRLAQKHGVRVEQSRDVAAYGALARETAGRDGYRGQAESFYKHFLNDLSGSFLLLAYPSASSDRPIAGLLGVLWGTQSIYYYGASSSEHRELMAPYLLQWEALRYCKAQGCSSYDLFGIAPEHALDHPWAGVSEFKAKFGGTVIAYPPEQELVLRPGMKRLLTIKRKLIG